MKRDKLTIEEAMGLAREVKDWKSADSIWVRDNTRHYFDCWFYDSSWKGFEKMGFIGTIGEIHFGIDKKNYCFLFRNDWAGELKVGSGDYELAYYIGDELMEIYDRASQLARINKENKRQETSQRLEQERAEALVEARKLLQDKQNK